MKKIGYFDPPPFFEKKVAVFWSPYPKNSKFNLFNDITFQFKVKTSPIRKSYSNFESPIQSEYAAKFSVQSGDWNCF
jgi:hypothetical protein